MAWTSLPDQLARTRRFTAGVPEQFTVALGGSAVLFLRGRCLWVLRLDSAAETLLADGSGIDAYATDADAGLVAFAVDGALWTVDVAGGPARRLPAREPVADPRPDPTGRWIAYLHHGALRVIGVDGVGDRAVAEPDGPAVTFGAAEHTDGRRGYWWSPDGTRLLVARVDSARVALWYLSDPTTPAEPPRAVRYAAVGRPHADVTLWIAALDGARTAARLPGFAYLVGAGWDDHGPYAAVESRDQRTVQLLGIDPVDAGSSVLHEERDDCWVQVVPGLPARTPAGSWVLSADRRGTRYLTVDGVAVTPQGLQLRAVHGCGEEVLFTASEEPTETHLWSYRAGVGLRRHSAEPGVHSGVLRGGTLVHVARCADRPGGRAVVRRPGRPSVPVLSLVERPVLDLHATRLVLGPRELRATLYLPSWYGPGGRHLPVLVDPYGGGGRQQVTTELEWRALVSQWFAEHGFAVLSADGRGTPGRGPDWERAVHGDLFGPVLDDQVDALHEAARRHPELDLDRVGIRGWSFGGSLAALAVLRRPDVFHAAVAGAGVTDQLLYDAHWRERFLGDPAEFPDRYEDASLIRAAPLLTRPLLLMHGLADDNVHPANTLRLSAALLAAGRPHEVLLLPGVGHQALGASGTAGLLWHQLRFLRRHLGG